MAVNSEVSLLQLLLCHGELTPLPHRSALNSSRPYLISLGVCFLYCWLEDWSLRLKQCEEVVDCVLFKYHAWLMPGFRGWGGKGPVGRVSDRANQEPCPCR